MSDCQKQFIEFHGKIELNDSNETKLQRGRDAIRDLIKDHFKNNERTPVPSFCSQGSFAMRTTINPLDGEFDLDDGVYLEHLDKKSNADWPTTDTVHRWICDAVDGHTEQPPVDKRTCVRVVYAGQYHIDLPIYAELNGDNLHAEKGARGWHKSDPIEITKWFQKAIKEHGEQLRRFVRYFKAWADFNSKDGKLPSSLILTVLAVQNFRAHDRDDLCFANTVEAIRNSVSGVFYVLNPTDGAEELTSRLDADQKKRFQTIITSLASEGNKATQEDSRSKATKIWQKQFGSRFPIAEDEDEDAKQKKADAERLASVYVAKTIKPWMPIVDTMV